MQIMQSVKIREGSVKASVKQNWRHIFVAIFAQALLAVHSLGSCTVEADGVSGRVVGCCLVAKVAGRRVRACLVVRTCVPPSARHFVQAPLHWAAAQVWRCACWLPRCVRRQLPRAARWLRCHLGLCGPGFCRCGPVVPQLCHNVVPRLLPLRPAASFV